MKRIIQSLLLAFVITGTAEANDSLSIKKDNFVKARHTLEQMLVGEKELNYEEAIYTIENAYGDNQLSAAQYHSSINRHVGNLRNIIAANRGKIIDNYNPDILLSAMQSKEDRAKKNKDLLANWAIYSYLTDTLFYVQQDSNRLYLMRSLPYQYSYTDPLGTADWSNTQVSHLLRTKSGNCFALASLYKILADRLHTDAALCTAPGHIYISHTDEIGRPYNIELSNGTFPGSGTIGTLTYTTNAAIDNDIALRQLDQKQAIALCIVYLAKGYQHKFAITQDDFMLQCAETALQYDPNCLNALLLKAEILEQRILVNNTTPTTSTKPPTYNEYEKLLQHLYALGYREMPLDMKNILVKGWQKDTLAVLQYKNNMPEKYNSAGIRNTRYGSLSWGLFDEEIKTKAVEQYGRTLFDTKTKKIKGFTNTQKLYNDYLFDPVAFAWNVDPLAHEFPYQSPYSAMNNNPIYFVDPDGRSGVAFKTEKKNEATGRPIMTVTHNKYIYGADANESNRKAIQDQSMNLWNNGGNYFTYTDGGTTYDVVFQFTTTIVNSADVDQLMIGDGNLHAENNFFEVRDDVSESYTLVDRDNRGGNAGVLKTSQIRTGSPTHEDNHGFGGINKDTEGETGYVLLKDLDIAVQDKNTPVPGKRKVTQQMINSIFNNVKFDETGKGNVGTPRMLKYDKEKRFVVPGIPVPEKK